MWCAVTEKNVNLVHIFTPNTHEDMVTNGLAHRDGLYRTPSLATNTPFPVRKIRGLHTRAEEAPPPPNLEGRHAESDEPVLDCENPAWLKGSEEHLLPLQGRA